MSESDPYRVSVGPMASDGPQAGPEMVVVPALAGFGIRHGFFGRRGGVSRGCYQSLNCGLGSDDNPAAVGVNRARAMTALGLRPEALATVRQVHSARALVVQRPWADGARPEADGLVTDRPGVALGILSADCAPLLLADADAGVVAAAHAGWRGAKDGIAEATVSAMVTLGARPGSIDAAVGPCIRQPSYEVGADFRAAFVADDGAAAEFFAPADRPGHARFDLAGYVGRRLTRLGLRSVTVTPFDTFADPDRFFSYRRVTLNGGGDYGRQLSVIALSTAWK
ncbi:MAG: peptidoglycan editing factor PgeF [Rhodospirillales bacterium]